MVEMIKKVEVSTGVYTIRKPIGRIGAKHFAILSRMVPARDMDGDDPYVMSPADMDRLGSTFEMWAAEVLPHIIVDGPCKYDEMPGEDQFGLFMAVMEDMGGDGKKPLFRVVG